MEIYHSGAKNQSLWCSALENHGSQRVDGCDGAFRVNGTSPTDVVNCVLYAKQNAFSDGPSRTNLFHSSGSFEVSRSSLLYWGCVSCCYAMPFQCQDLTLFFWAVQPSGGFCSKPQDYLLFRYLIDWDLLFENKKWLSLTIAAVVIRKPGWSSICSFNWQEVAVMNAVTFLRNWYGLAWASTALSLTNLGYRWSHLRIRMRRSYDHVLYLALRT